MISGHDFYTVLSATTPLYVAMILAYGSVKWWKIFTPDQCAGINRFVAVFAVPLLSFTFISTNNPYAMNLRFIAADSLQKIIVLTTLTLWARFAKRGTLDWLITIFSLATLPNTLVMGIPLLVAMYGEYCQSLMVQIVVMQCIAWYTLLIFLFEYRAAKILIAEQFPDSAASIASLKVEQDVVSLDRSECLENDSAIGDDGKLHVTLRKSNASASGPRRSFDIAPPRPSRFSESDRNCSIRNSSFGAAPIADSALKPPSPRTTVFSEAEAIMLRNTSKKNSQLPVRGDKELAMSISSNSPARESSRVNNHELEIGPKVGVTEPDAAETQMPPASVMTRLIMVMVWRKLIRNPNTYASLLGIIWSLVHFKWNVKMPLIVDKSIAILSNAGLGMAMFTLGLFMALQPSLIPCGKAAATHAMALRFIAGPSVMAAVSLVLGIRGDLLRVAIVQAALPQAIVTFVFAKEYDVHPQIQSTAVIFGMLIALPVTLIYYILLGL